MEILERYDLLEQWLIDQFLHRTFGTVFIVFSGAFCLIGIGNSEIGGGHTDSDHLASCQ